MLRRMRRVAIVVAVAALGAALATRSSRRRGGGARGRACIIGRERCGAVCRRICRRHRRWPACRRCWSRSPIAPRRSIRWGRRCCTPRRRAILPSSSISTSTGRGRCRCRRGIASSAASPAIAGRVRADALTIDVVDARTRRTRTIYVTTGFEAHLAALAGDEIIVYLVQPGVASLRAVDWRSGRERVVVASLPPYAHDFTVERALVVHNRDDARTEFETIERIDLGNGQSHGCRRSRRRSEDLALAVATLAPSALAFCPSPHCRRPTTAATAASKRPRHQSDDGRVAADLPARRRWPERGHAIAVGEPCQGCGKPETQHDVPAVFPCELLRAIAMQESSWQQFCVPDSPADQVGGASRTIISFDRGYGVGQVTSGMHKGETPRSTARVSTTPPTTSPPHAADPRRPVASPTNCVGDRAAHRRGLVRRRVAWLTGWRS